MAAVEKDRAFYGGSGGIAISGGEPMFHPKQTLALLSTCREKGIGTAIETCGYFHSDYLPALVENTDVFLWDLKDMDEKHYSAVAEVYHSLSGCDEVELLPYHVYGGSKTLAIGKTDCGNKNWIPGKEQIIQVCNYLRNCNVNVKHAFNHNRMK